MSMTPAQYLAAQLTTALEGANPNADQNPADAGSAPALAMALANMWANLILPNLQVDLTTGKITFIVPAGN